MFFGMGQNNKKPLPGKDEAGHPLSDAGPPAVIFDAGAADFEDKVMRTSVERPVLVDFWAPWCGPCKQLGPVLEKVVREAGGKVLMAKVNLDENQELAAALRIQSVPTVFAFFQGRPVDAFQGNMPETQIREFIKKLTDLARQTQPDALDIPAALKEAAQALAARDLQTAQALYTQILGQDETNSQAYAGLVRTFIAAQKYDQAREMLGHAPEAMSRDSALAEARTALELAENLSGSPAEELKAKIESNPADHQARLDLANAQFAAGEKESAVDTLLESIALNREWNEEAARKQLLKYFEALGPVDPVTVAGRRKLSSVLFS